VEPAFRDQLQAEADARGKPLTQEVERRLRASFETSSIPADLQQRLREAARTSGRGEEAELAERLRQSFRDDDRLTGPSFETRSLLGLFESVISLIENRTGRSWAADHATAEAVKLAVRTILYSRMPSADEADAEASKDTSLDEQGRALFLKFISKEEQFIEHLVSVPGAQAAHNACRRLEVGEIDQAQFEAEVSHLDPELVRHTDERYVQLVKLLLEAKEIYTQIDERDALKNNRERYARRLADYMRMVAEGNMSVEVADQRLERLTAAEPTATFDALMNWVRDTPKWRIANDVLDATTDYQDWNEQKALQAGGLIDVSPVLKGKPGNAVDALGALVSRQKGSGAPKGSNDATSKGTRNRGSGN
jgi:hypothetical protein